VDCHAEAASDEESCNTMPFRLGFSGAVRRSRANPLKHRAGKPVGEAGHEAVESGCELLARYRRQDHWAG